MLIQLWSLLTGAHINPRKPVHSLRSTQLTLKVSPLGLLCLLSFVCPLRSRAQALPTERATLTYSFTSNVGVVTHLSYTNTPYYTAFPQILSALESLGVHHIRDGYYPWPLTSPIVQAHKSLAQAGIKCTYVVPYNTSTTSAAIQSLASSTGDMEALEAPNECDVNGGCGASGNAGLTNLVHFLPTIDSAALKLGVPVVGPSFVLQSSYPYVGNIDPLMNLNNLHIYFGGRNPGSAGWGDYDPKGNSYGSFNWWLDQAAIDGPGIPSEITETGYIATPTTSTPYTLPEDVEASYIPRTLLLAYKHGFQKTMIYELIDEVSSPGYGLLHSDLTPKPAFTAVKNLLAILRDSGGNANFVPGSLAFTITGADPTLNHVLLQKRDGSFWLVLWLEQSSWDPARASSQSITPQNIGLELSNSYKTTTDYQFDSLGGVSGYTQPMNGNWASLTVTDQISIVRIVHR